jgi:putative transposase
MRRKHLGKVFHELAAQKNWQVVEAHLMPDYVHMCISIYPKHSVSYVVGYIKGKKRYIDCAEIYGKIEEFHE